VFSAEPDTVPPQDEFLVVDAWAGDDEPIDALGQKEVAV